MLVAHHLRPDLHRIVIDLAPRTGVAEKTERMSRKMAEAVEAVPGMHAAEIAPDVDLATAAAVIETLLVALAQEATRMITRYLAAAG
ncbi:MAG: hypothetical protein J0I21_02625 [Alphaproteobacteria bacterium]|nr:hypothetical protein [Alphaproteobacteria bacterium]